MLTPEQQKWIDHLSDIDLVKIFPFDPTAEEKYLKVKQRVEAALGEDFTVEHHGATSLGISGQDEIDLYIPVPQKSFDAMVDPLKGLFGEPRSFYPMERVRFQTEVDGKHIDVFLINRDNNGWKNAVKFEGYLRSHPEALEEYRKLKEAGVGLTIREYYRRKTEFINEIVAKSESEK